jgi:hypothetical protein
MITVLIVATCVLLAALGFVLLALGAIVGVEFRAAREQGLRGPGRPASGRRARLSRAAALEMIGGAAESPRTRAA